MTGSAAPGAAPTPLQADATALSHEARVKRALWRAGHRGTKEMDFMIGRFAQAKVALMSAAELARFEMLLQMPDPDLQRWLTAPGDDPIEGDFAPEIAAIRQFLAQCT